MSTKDNDARRAYTGNRNRGPGRRTYPSAAGNAPRVGRIAPNVPRAQRVDAAAGEGERPFDPEAEPRRERRGSDLHRGDAYRAPTGPRQYKRAMDGAQDGLPGDDHILAGRNPIREALKAGRPVEKLLVASGDLSGGAQEIIGLAREAGAVVQRVDRARLDQIYPAHQGMLAYVAAVSYVELEDILAAAADKGEEPFLVLLDGITDPHNLGAIVRTAECAGAHGVVIPERRAAGLTPAAAKAAAGALNYMPIARVKNLNRAIEALQAKNIWVVGTAMEGEDAFIADLSGPVALVIGSEGEGIARLTLEKCDRTVALPMKGQIESLNASVAAGILMYEIARARAR